MTSKQLKKRNEKAGDYRLVFLKPTDSHKSFYGKAKVRIYDNGDQELLSYDLPVIYKTKAGDLYRLWDCWSATTGRHVKAFCGLNKKEYLNLQLIEGYLPNFSDIHFC